MTTVAKSEVVAEIMLQESPSFWQVFIRPSMMSLATRPSRPIVPHEIFRLLPKVCRCSELPQDLQ